MVDVPFTVWNVDDNKQLSVSFRDQEMNGVYNINPRDPDDAELMDNREYLFIHATDYSETPNAAIAKKQGHRTNLMYFIWPYLADGNTWDASKLPTATFRLNVGSLVYQKGKITKMTDIYIATGAKNPHQDHHILVTATTSSGFLLISGNDGGVAYTDKASTAEEGGDGSFIRVNTGGYNTGMSYTVSKKAGASEYMTGMQDNDVYFSGSNPNAGDDWKSANTHKDGMGVLYHATNPKLMLASGQGNWIYKSVDAGITWSEVNIRDKDEDAPFVTKLEASDKAPDVVWAVGKSGLFKSTGFGSSFSPIKMGDGWDADIRSWELRISDRDANVVWAGSTMAEGKGSIFYSRDGKAFRACRNYVTGLTGTDGTPVEMGNVSGIYPDPNDTKVAYLLFSQPKRPKVLKTVDEGKTWKELSGFGTAGVSSNGFPDVGVYSMLVFPEGKQIWVGSDIGLLESKDGGETWALANNGLPSVPVYDIRYREKQIVVATHGLGIFSLDKELTYKTDDGGGGGGGGGTTGIFDGNNAVEISVYPNPTSDWVRFELPEIAGGSYDIAVYSISGQDLMKKSVKKGGNVELNLSSLNRGTYVIQATASDGKVYSQKVVVEK
jgi:photosystem II stability/assembly factor-like uncharacterized protein